MLQFREQLPQRHGLRYEKSRFRAHDSRHRASVNFACTSLVTAHVDVEALFREEFENVRGVAQANDVIDPFRVHGHSRVPAHFPLLVPLLERRIALDRHKVEERRHDRVHGHVIEGHDSPNHVVLLAFDRAGVFGALEHEFQFLLGDRRGEVGARLVPEEREDAPAHRREEPADWVQHLRDEAERVHNLAHDRLCALDGDALGHDFRHEEHHYCHDKGDNCERVGRVAQHGRGRLRDERRRANIGDGRAQQAGGHETLDVTFEESEG